MAPPTFYTTFCRFPAQQYDNWYDYVKYYMCRECNAVVYEYVYVKGHLHRDVSFCSTQSNTTCTCDVQPTSNSSMWRLITKEEIMTYIYL